MKSILKSVAAALFLLICGISTSTAQNHHKFDYMLNESGVHFEWASAKEIKVIENNGQNFIVGDFAIVEFDANEGISTLFRFGVSESGAGKVSELLKHNEGDLTIELSNGEVFQAFGAEIKKNAKILSHDAMIEIPVSFLHSNSVPYSKGAENKKYVLRQFSTYDVSSLRICNQKFVFDTAVEKPFKTSKMIKAMIDDLRTKIKNKNVLAY